MTSNTAAEQQRLEGRIAELERQLAEAKGRPATLSHSTSSGAPSAGSNATPGRTLSPWTRYLITLATFPATLLIRLAIGPILGDHLRHLVFVPAIVLCTWFGGITAGLITSLLATVVAERVFTGHPRFFSLSDPAELASTLIFLSIGMFLVWLTDHAHTSQRQTEASARKLEQILETMGDACVVLNQHWRFVYVNQRACDLAHLPRAQALGAELWSVFPEAAESPIGEELRRAMRDRTTACMEYHHQPSGLWVEADVHPSDEGLTIFFRDITGKKKAEEVQRKLNQALSEERERLELILEQMPVGVVIAEAGSGRLAAMNHQINRIWRGLPESFNTLADYRLYRGFHPDGRPYEAPEWPLARTLTSGEAVHGEQIDIIRNDGESGQVEVNTAPIRDFQGELVAAVAVVADVTERRKSEAALIESDAFNRSIIQSSLDCIKVLSLDGTLLSMNPRGQDLLEIADLSPYLGTPWIDLWAGKHREAAIAALESAKAGGAGDFEGFKPTASAQPKWWHVVATPILDERGKPKQLLVVSRDITERKRSHQVLRESMERLKLTQAAAGIGGWDWDLETGELTWSPEIYQMLGLAVDVPPSEHLWIGLIVPEDRERAAAESRRAIEAGLPLEVEYRMVRTDGSVRWILSKANVLRDDAGKPTRMLGMALDTTDRHKVNDELQRAKNRASHILESISDAFFALDNDWRFTYLNREAEVLLNRSREDLLGKNIWEEFHPAAGSPFEIAYRHAKLENITVQFEEFYQPLQTWFEVRAYPASKGLAVYFRNVTERKQAEQALRMSEERFRRIVETAAEGICITGSDSRITFINQRMAELLDYPAERIIGHSCFEFIYEEDAASVRLSFVRVAQGAAERRDYRVRRRDGSVVWCNSSATAMKDQASGFMGVLEMLTDVSARKEAEMAIQRSNHELRLANAGLEQFAYAAAHDLQEPLRNVSLYTELLKRRYGGKFDADADQFMATTVEGAQRMQNLIQDLLAYTRAVDPGDPAAAETDASRVLRDVMANLKTAIDASAAEVTSGDLPVLPISRAHLAQLLQNLIGNALKYRGADSPRVHVSAGRDGGEWIVTVSDHGIGIAPEYQERIFGVFRRLHGRSIPGTGIGLAICARIVSHYGGRIWVESEPGKGAMFHFALPVMRSEE